MYFTNLEKDILEQLALLDPKSELAIQLSACTFSDREITPVGFFTGLTVPKTTPDLPHSNLNFNGPRLCAPELEVGASILLHCSEARVKNLEVWTNAGESVFRADGKLVLSNWWFEEEDINIIDLRET